MATGGRKTQYQTMAQIGLIVGLPTIAPALIGAGAGAGVMGVIPAGAILNMLHVWMGQAFNSTTNTFSLGTTPGGTQLANAVDMKTPARTDAVVPIASCGPFGVDTPIYYTFAFTGGAPNVGLMAAWLDYLPGPG